MSAYTFCHEGLPFAMSAYILLGVPTFCHEGLHFAMRVYILP